MLTLALVLLTPLQAPPSTEVTAPRELLSRTFGEACTLVSLRPLPVVAPPVRRVPDEGADAAAESTTSTRVLGGRSSFSAARTIDLQLAFVVRRHASPDARLELRLYTPKGHLYQTLRAARPSPSSTPGPVRSTRDPWTAALRVAGTAIVNHSLYGRWTVQPHLDGNPHPCGSAQPFWIDP